MFEEQQSVRLLARQDCAFGAFLDLERGGVINTPKTFDVKRSLHIRTAGDSGRATWCRKILSVKLCLSLTFCC